MHIPDYGAIGFHAKGRGWFIDLYIWRRGPWRVSWSLSNIGISGAIETPICTSFLSRTLADVLSPYCRLKTTACTSLTNQ
jgi:hypothetical protein